MSKNDGGPRCWNDMACEIHRCRELGCACLRNSLNNNLRDDFAASALQGWMATYSSSQPCDGILCNDNAALAYRIADAMLAERAK